MNHVMNRVGQYFEYMGTTLVFKVQVFKSKYLKSYVFPVHVYFKYLYFQYFFLVFKKRFNVQLTS